MFIQRPGLLFFVLFPTLLLSCGETKRYEGKNEPQRRFIVKEGIAEALTYERSCKDPKESLASKTVYNDLGEEIEYESYFGGAIFTHTSQVYENGLLMEKIYHASRTNPKTTVKYEYNEQGQKTKYAIFDSLDNRIMLNKIERVGRTESVSEYDAKGKLTDYRTTLYDSMEHPLLFETRKLRYSYNQNGLMTESASVDTISGSFIRRVYEYREFLPVKQTVYIDDTCRSIIRYEYKTTSGENW